MSVSGSTAELLDHNGAVKASAVARAGARNGLLALLAVLLVGAFYLLTIRQGHDWGDDFAMYIQHAKNIAEGRDYRDGGYLHYAPYLGPEAYPPIFPLLLAPVYRVFGLNLTAMKALVIALFMAALLLLRMVVKDHLPVEWQVALLALVGFNPAFWKLKDWLMSEIPFMVMVYLGLYLVHKAYQAEESGKGKWLYAVATGCTFYLAYGTRSIGIVLLPCLLLYDLLRNRRPTLFAATVTAVTAALVIFQSLLLRSASGYLTHLTSSLGEPFSVWVKYILQNIVAHAFSLTDFWDNGHHRPARLALTVIISLLAAAGFLLKLRKQVSFVELFMAIYVIAVLVAPMDGGVRFLIPVIPLYVFYALLGAYALPRRKGIRGGVLATLAVAVATSYVALYAKMDFRQVPDGVTKVEAAEFFDYVRRANEGDVFIFTKPRALALLTGCKSSYYPVMLDDKALWDYFRRIKASHIVLGPRGVEPNEQAFLAAFVAKYAGSLQEEYTNADFNVYRIMGIPQASGRTAYARYRMTDPLPEGEAEGGRVQK